MKKFFFSNLKQYTVPQILILILILILIQFNFKKFFLFT